MFLPTADYVTSRILVPGGFTDLAGEFLIQYFMYPYVGAIITTLLLTVITLTINAVLSNINKEYNWLIPACIPSLFLLFLHFDFNYEIAGTVAFLLMLVVLWGSLAFKNDLYRLVYNLMAVFLLFWLCGSVFVLYTVLVVLYEFILAKKYRLWSLLFVILVLTLGVLSLRLAWVGEYRLIFLPDIFYHAKLQPQNLIYFSWIALILLYIAAFFIKPIINKKTAIMLVPLIGSLVIVLLITYWGVQEYGDQKALHVKKLDYLARTKQWDAIMKESEGELKNYLYLSYLNLALAEKGILAERMFLYDQRGVDGLFLKWNKTFSISILLSDIYFAIGNIAIAQEMAFEANVCALGGGNPRMIKRLIETNLIYGEYEVAEKYIRLLEETVYYKKWASEQRRFLYNDEAVENDSLLGEKRRGLLPDSYLANMLGGDKDLLNMAEHYPTNKAPIEFYGSLILLAKDLPEFKKLLDTYYNTEVLPVLPHGFQEAVIILAENNPEEWLKYGVSQSVIERFGQYRKTILANKNNQALPRLVAHEFGNTYWYYFMFK